MMTAETMTTRTSRKSSNKLALTPDPRWFSKLTQFKSNTSEPQREEKEQIYFILVKIRKMHVP